MEDNTKINDLVKHAASLRYHHFLLSGDFNHLELDWLKVAAAEGP